MKSAAILMITVLVAGCGYVRSGKWDDDPKNWGRALKSTRPDDVVVVHSLYRIVYSIDDDHRTISIVKIGDRKEVYR